MGRVLRFALAIIVGLVVGSAVNMGLILLGGAVVPPPAGADVTTMEGLKAAMPHFGPQHFAFPFLAHALGTFAGALLGTWIAPGRSAVPASVVGIAFLIGGIVNVVMLPAPLWFSVLDLVAAYLPPAWVAWRLMTLSRGSSAARP